MAKSARERSGALDVRGGGGERATQAGQLLALLRRERAKGIFLGARHGAPRGSRIASPGYQVPQQSTPRGPWNLFDRQAPLEAAGPCERRRNRISLTQNLSRRTRPSK